MSQPPAGTDFPPLPRPGRPRGLAPVHWQGIYTIWLRDQRRFFGDALEWIGGYMISSLLFVTVFDLAWTADLEAWPGVSMTAFIAPGVTAFALFATAFQATAAALVYDKLEGMLADVLMAPLMAWEIMAGMLLSAMTCALVNGVLILLVISLFIELPMAQPLLTLGFALLGALLFAALGLIIGILAQRWDGFSAAETFLLLPLGLLSGSFFMIDSLPALGQTIMAFNPVYYAIDGFRAGVVGQAETSLWRGAAVLLAVDLLLLLVCWRLLATGYKIKP